MKPVLSPATKRERKHQRSALRLVKPTGDFNPHSYDHRCAVAEACAYEAVQTVFGWLSIDEMKSPSRKHKDAQLARQVAIRIMVHDLGIELRHVTRMQKRQRTSTHFAIRTVDQRLNCEMFAQGYERMANLARAEFDQRVNFTLFSNNGAEQWT